MVGPFIFLDQMGPEMLRANTGLDVAPHPHIGLATVTYLFEGELLHRDSLGVVQPIRPGEVNWMTAGKGIVHSERTPQEMRQMGSKLFGIQSWVALPQRDEETDPAFAHHGADELPVIEGEGKRVRLISGSLYGARSPVRTLSEMFYADVTIEEGAAYVVEGSVEFLRNGGSFAAGQLLVFKPGEEITLQAPESSPVRVMLLGVRGKVVVFITTSSRLPVRARQVASLRNLIHDYSPRGVDFYLVSTDSESRKSKRYVSDEQLRQFARELELPLKVLRDPGGETTHKYGRDLIPLIVVLNKEGRVDGKPIQGYGQRSAASILRPQLARLTK